MVNSIVRSIVVMLIGVLLIFWSSALAVLSIRIVGAAFFLPAAVSLVSVLRGSGARFSKALISVIDVGSMAFGLWLLISPSGFVALFVKVLAALLLLFAVFQVVQVALARRRGVVPAWAYVVPLLLFVVVAVLLLSSLSLLEGLSVLFGVVAVISGASDLIISLRMRKVKEVTSVEILKTS